MPWWGSTWRRPTTARTCSPPPWHAWSASTHRAWLARWRPGSMPPPLPESRPRRTPARRPGPTARVRRKARHADPDPVAWYWIVHDDSAPQPDCLAALLRGADRNPAAAVLVPKTVAWPDPGRLVGVGNRWAPGTPVVDPLDPTERDQGQYDVDRGGLRGGLRRHARACRPLAPARGDGLERRRLGRPGQPVRRAWGCRGKGDLRALGGAGPPPGRAPRRAGRPGRIADITGPTQRTRGARPGPASSPSSSVRHPCRHCPGATCVPCSPAR